MPDCATLRIAALSRSHLAMQKPLASQILATISAVIARLDREGLWFRREVRSAGFRTVLAWRDSGRPIAERDGARVLIREMESHGAGPHAGG